MFNATLQRPDLAAFCGLDALGLEVIGLILTLERAVLTCRVIELDDWCHRCGIKGSVRDSITRRVSHVPFG